MKKSPGKFTVGCDVSSSSTFCTQGGIGDASSFCILPGSQNPINQQKRKLDIEPDPKCEKQDLKVKTEQTCYHLHAKCH